MIVFKSHIIFTKKLNKRGRHAAKRDLEQISMVLVEHF